ncbi:hypothetical protein JOC48_002200 [Aquibacillus albus]|uniref:Uncharacterized protein n=1 Tax=Aquibacillus albus TaxID=1168171 RepID=A0ABS2N0M4_9BACI|nr:hypothetical protein [Aquibacillus albus]
MFIPKHLKVTDFSRIRKIERNSSLQVSKFAQYNQIDL